MNLRIAGNRRGFSLQDPWLAVVAVVVLAAAAFVLLRALGVESRVRISVQRNLAVLADSQAAHKRRFGTWARRLGGEMDSASVRMIPDSGAIITITNADSAGWTASATHPALHGRRSTCYVFGGGAAHDPKLVKAGEPRCW